MGGGGARGRVGPAASKETLLVGVASTFPGMITAHISGNNYTVSLYMSGMAGATTSKTVQQLDIASNEVIPNGTWVLVGANTASGSSTPEYTMQVPVWL